MRAIASRTYQYADVGPIDKARDCDWLTVIFSAHDDIPSIKQSRPYLIIAQYGVDLVPIFLRDRHPLLLLLLLLRFFFL
jgi:hypothetical protein